MDRMTTWVLGFICGSILGTIVGVAMTRALYCG